MTTTATASPDRHAKRRRLLPAEGKVVLFVLCAAQFMLILDIVVVNVAIPSIRADLAIADSRLQLVSVAYTLTFGSLLIVAGRTGDIIGRRRMFLVGLGVFTAASALTGLASAPWHLFAGRSLQGVGAALVSPTALALLTSRFAEGTDRNLALGAWAAVGSAGAIAGQLVGGLLTHSFGWRSIFLINIPVGIAAVVVARRVLAESRGAGGDRRMDVAGAIALTLGLATLAYTLGRIAERAPLGDTLGLVTVAAVILAAFVVIERRQTTPLLRFELLRQRTVRQANLMLLLNTGALTGGLFFITLYLQVVIGLSPFETGMAFAPITAVILVLSPRAGSWTGRFGARPLLFGGLMLLAAGMVLLARVPVGGSYWRDVLPGMALLALGSGLAYAPTFIAGMTRVGEGDQGLASGFLSTSQEIGAAMGLAILASLAAFVTAGTGTTAGPSELAEGYRAGFLAAGVVMVTAAMLALRLPGEVGKAPAELPEVPQPAGPPDGGTTAGVPSGEESGSSHGRTPAHSQR